MTILSAFAAALYLVLGNHFWHVVIMRPIDERDLIDGITDDELMEMVAHRHSLSEGHQTPAQVIAKATMILLWPVVLLFGKVVAAWQDRNR